MMDVKIDVTTYEKVQISILVIISERGARMPGLTACYAGLSGDISKSPVSIIPVKDVRAKVRDQQIFKSVVIKICCQRSVSPTPALHSRTLGDIGEGAITVIAKQIIVRHVRSNAGFQKVLD